MEYIITTQTYWLDIMYFMARRGDADTISNQVRDQLRADILAGCWAPGEKLLLLKLSERYQTSSTVTREALTRLTGERLVELKPNRGFFVPELSLSELSDFNELRCLSEEFGISLAIERGDLRWESEVHAAHHLMERTPRYREEDATQLNEEWVIAHAAFHAKLIEACNVPVLIDLAATLSDATSLYRRWSMPTQENARRDIGKEHRAILDAVTARNAKLAGQLLREHYTATMRYIFDSGLIDEQDRPELARISAARRAQQ